MTRRQLDRRRAILRSILATLDNPPRAVRPAQPAKVTT